MDEPEAWDLPSSDELRYAVAIHEAGHAVVFACCGIDVLRMQLSEPGSPLTGDTKSDDIIAANRTDFVASLMAGDIAVEVMCDPSVASRMKSAGDQQLLRYYIPQIDDFGDHERDIARRTAREIIEAQRRHVIAVADALIAAPGGLLVGDALDELLAPVRDECDRSRRGWY